MRVFDQILAAIETARTSSLKDSRIGAIGEEDENQDNASSDSFAAPLDLSRYSPQQLAQLWRDSLELIRSKIRLVFSDIIAGETSNQELGGQYYNEGPVDPSGLPARGSVRNGPSPASDDDKILALLAVDDVVRVVLVALKTLPPQSTTEHIWPIAFTLHDLLLSLPRHPMVKTQELISELCELWWRQDRAGREEVAPQAMSWMLMRSLSDDGKGADVKRVYAMKDALCVFDWDDESAETIKVLVGHCFHKPSFFKSPEGKKFLVFALSSLSSAFVEELHEFVKAQIPFCDMSLVLTYGEIYFKAWKASEGVIRSRIETCCIQSLMHHAVHAPPKIPMPTIAGGGQISFFNRLRAMLGKFHEQKSQQGVDSMLCRLYEPILWRGMYAANEQVRKNSLCLMVDAFPLLDPTADAEEREELMIKQYEMLKSFLRDDCPAIRIEAIRGIFRILSGLWELVPLAVAEGFINVVIGDLGFDMSDAGVRVAVVEGMGQLLQKQIRSHDVLKGEFVFSELVFVLCLIAGIHFTLWAKEKLPALRSLINDSAEKVRVEICNLLMFLTKHRTIHFFDVVPIDDLVFRLGNDTSPQVRKRVARVLMATFFPENQQPGEKISRCREFLVKDTIAAQTFYYYLPKLGKANNVASFVIALNKLLVLLANDEQDENQASGVAVEAAKRKKRKKDGPVVAQSSVDEDMKANFMPYFGGLLDVLAVTLDSLMKEKHKDGKIKDSIQQAFIDSPLSMILAKCTDGPAKDAVLSIASHFSLEQIRKMGITPAEFEGSLHSAVRARGGNSDKLVSALSELSVASSGTVQGTNSRNRGKRRSRDEEDERVSQTTASEMEWLNVALQDPDQRKGLFASSELGSFLDNLKACMENAPLLSIRPTQAGSKASPLEAVCKLTLHCYANPTTREALGEGTFDVVLELLEGHVRNNALAKASSPKPKHRNNRHHTPSAPVALDDVSVLVIKLCIEYATLGFCSPGDAKRLLRGFAALVESALVDLPYHLKLLDQIAFTVLDEDAIDPELLAETQDMVVQLAKQIVESNNLQTLTLLRPLLTDIVRVLSRHARLGPFARRIIRSIVTPRALGGDTEEDAEEARVHPVLQMMWAVFGTESQLREGFWAEIGWIIKDRAMVTAQNGGAHDGQDNEEDEEHEEDGEEENRDRIEMKNRIKEFAKNVSQKFGESKGLKAVVEACG
ncbi:Condensin-2 complex subunit G2 [Gonapodya sp. JEL0774]|nr:Condensin-2 complex subunit G2 [Gonapodya sp. JEL0774]